MMNANVLKYLLAHPELIPEGWKKYSVFFWGTTYRDPEKNAMYVPYLRFVEGKWEADLKWVGSGFYADSPAALYYEE